MSASNAKRIAAWIVLAALTWLQSCLLYSAAFDAWMTAVYADNPKPWQDALYLHRWKPFQ